jgi:hypothetical protein
VKKHRHILLSLALCLAAGSPALAAPTPTATPAGAVKATDAATPPPAPTTLVGPTAEIDTYRIASGKSAGYDTGDHVRIIRGGKIVAEGILMKVGPRSAEVTVVGRSSGAPRAGDIIEFVKRRDPPPKDVPVMSTWHGPSPLANNNANNNSGTFLPSDWKELGSVKGLIGDDWMTRNTRTCTVYVRKTDKPYVDEVVNGLDESYDVNRAYMGLEPPLPMTFIFCPLANPAHTQPRFAVRLAQRTRIAGIAMPDINTVCVNLGNWRAGSHYEPWEVAKTCRHEMNHLFAYTVKGADREGTWHFFFEALAHTIEDTARPASARLDLPLMKEYMAGYKDKDASWASLIQDRDNDELEQYRDYDRLLISIIFYLRDKYGSDAVAHIMQAARGHDIEDALTAVTGKGVKALEVEWKQYYGIKSS